MVEQPQISDPCLSPPSICRALAAGSSAPPPAFLLPAAPSTGISSSPVVSSPLAQQLHPPSGPVAAISSVDGLDQLPPFSSNSTDLIPTAYFRPGKSFASILAAGNILSTSVGHFNAFRQPLASSFENLLAGESVLGDPVGIKKATVYNGKPCIYLTNEELKLLNKPLELTLIGKFPAGRPKWLNLKKHFDELNLKGTVKLSNLDARHFIIHFSAHEDYIKVFSRRISSINSFSVKFLKWSMDFDAKFEPSITPIWISFPNLCMNMFTQSMLFSLAEVYGKPLLLDSHTSSGTRPFVARVLVEMDVLIDHPNEVWVGNDEFGYNQQVNIERKPKYCAHCRKYGHTEKECFIKNPEIQRKKTDKQMQLEKGIQEEGEQALCSNVIREQGDGKTNYENDQGINHVQELFWVNYMKEVDEDKRKQQEENEKQRDRVKENTGSMKDLNQVNTNVEEIAGKGKHHEVEIASNVKQGDIDIIETGESKRANDSAVADDEYEKIAAQIIEKTVINLIEECYNNTFTPNKENENIQNQLTMVSESEDSQEVTLAPNTIGTSKEMKRKNETRQLMVNPSLLTKPNLMDLYCLGFDFNTTQDDGEIKRAKDIEIPPHSKTRRKSLGDENSEEVSTTNKSKKGRRKKNEMVNLNLGSPRITRGKAKEFLEAESYTMDND